MIKRKQPPIRLAARPVGNPKRSDWSFTEEPLGEPVEGGVLVKVLQLSLDPAMRGWMNEGKFKSREHLVDGLPTFPETLNMLFEGKNFGKLVLKVADS